MPPTTNHATEFPSEKLQAHNERVLESRRAYQSGHISRPLEDHESGHFKRI